MALRLGIGDAFTLCKAAVDVCTNLPHQARHEDHSSVIAEMKLMRSHLQSLESQIGDESSFATRRPDIAPAIKRSLEPLHRDLTELRELVGQRHDYTQRKKSLHVMDQARFLILYKARLDGFKQNLPAHRESICVMRELIEEGSPNERRKSIMRLDQILETYENQLNDQEVREQDLAELLENNASEDFVGAGEQAMEKDTGAAHDPACPRFKLDLFNSVPRTEDNSEQVKSWPETNIEQRVGLDREKLGSGVSPLLK